MKKLLLIILIFFFTPVALAEVNINIPKESLVVYSDQTSTISITIVNNGSTPEGFSISIFPPQYYGYGVVSSVYPQIVFIPPKSEKNVTVYFTALKSAKPLSTIFTLTVQSISNPQLNYTKQISVLVLRKSPVYISDLTLNKYTFNPNEIVGIKVKLTNVVNQLSPLYKLELLIEYQGKTIKKYSITTDNVPPDSSLLINESYVLDKYAPNGSYLVKATLLDLAGNYIDSAEKEFTVRAVYKLPESYTKKQTSWSLLATTTKITIKNEGNVPTPEFYVKEQMPVFMKDFFQPETKPTKVEVKGSIVTY